MSTPLGVYSMHKKMGKFLALALTGVTAMGVAFSSACSNVYSRDALDGEGIFTEDAAVSNGGFVVEKGNYIYFINGVEAYTANNTYGTPVKGSLMRISKSDFAARKYANAQVVVPSVIYSGSYSSGIYIYGDYVYYSTPSTKRDSEGGALNSQLDFKRAKLDGSEAMKGAIYTASSNSIEYRFVEVDNTVYLLYYLSEDLDDEGSVTNIHSVKINADGTTTDTLLAYNVSGTPVFPADLEDPYIYYTMTVTDNNVSFSSYNQLYRVKADDTTEISVDKSRLTDATEDDDDVNEDAIVYQNYGELLLDGISNLADTTPVTQLNYEYKKGENVTSASTHAPYTYAISSIENGYVYLTISSTVTSSQTASYYYRYATSAFNDLTKWNPVTANPEANGKDCYIEGYSDYTNPKLVTVGSTTKLIYEEDSSLKIGEVVEKNGTYEVDENSVFVMTNDSSVTYLTTTTEGDYQYLYYAASGTNGYSVNRIAYNGAKNDYTDSLTNPLPTTTQTTAYNAVKVLAVDAVSDWFLPELIEGQLIFASEIEEMNTYNYIQVCDLRADVTSTATMTNAQLNDLNNLYEGVLAAISDIDSDVYENLPDALTYYFWASAIDDTAEEYVDTLSKAYVDIEGKKETYLYSAESKAMYHDFAKRQNDFATIEVDDTTVDFTQSKQVNGTTVYANSSAYYYSVLGTVTDDDMDSWLSDIKASYMSEYPEDTSTWWDNFSTVGKVFFIIGMCAAGIIVIALLAVGGLALWNRKKMAKNGATRRKRYKVDTTDDKNIDVYEDDKKQEETNE
jgi:hypothetical protein